MLKIHSKSEFWIQSLSLTCTQPTQTSLRRLHDVLKRSRRLTTKQDVVTTSGKRHRIYDVLNTSVLLHLEEFQFTTSWRGLIYVVLKTSNLRLPEDVWLTSTWRRPIRDVLKMSDLQRLQDVWFTTSWRRPIYVVLKTSNLRRLEDVGFKTSVKRHLCSNVVATSIQRRMKWLFLIVCCLKYSENFKCSSLTHILPMLHFCTPWKRQKIFGFLTFVGGTEI